MTTPTSKRRMRRVYTAVLAGTWILLLAQIVSLFGQQLPWR